MSRLPSPEGRTAALDHHTRLAYAVIHRDEQADTCAGFLHTTARAPDPWRGRSPLLPQIPRSCRHHHVHCYSHDSGSVPQWRGFCTRIQSSSEDDRPGAHVGKPVLVAHFASISLRQELHHMGNSLQSPHLAGRLLKSVALVSVLALGATACSGSDPEPGSADETVAPDTKEAKKALDAGLAAHADGDLVAAEESYQTALEYDATNQYAFYNLALIDEANGNYGLAEDNYRSALETDAKYGPALFNLAILRTASGDTKEAISLYERAVAADKKDAAAWLNLGLLLRDNGQERVGDEDVLRALALDPSLKDPAAD